HPLLGDDLYGTPDARIDRHALHALSLEFPLPFADGRICINAPVAADMLALIHHYFPRYS
ncbi:MAG: RluA family pseudouridine synthase, partial [Clostridia bacterium]|nr:RluA family pseudouridine synthase [Clostridia bacterium]